ncbi:MAG: hypothetical protein H6715_05230 [Myxococcales bacterium]|nr:hypothetical protein [Myxococcales bacterium]MCB9709246.1 hypothetical protein [Myxococcales bacterium]
MSMEPSDAVFHFLESVAPATEAEFYLNLFRAQAKESFALIAVQRGIAEHALDAVAVDLRCLALLGLTPVVVLGVDNGSHTPRSAERLLAMLNEAKVQAAEAAPVVSAIRKLAAGGIIPVVALPPQKTHDGLLTELTTTLESRKLVFLHRKGALKHHQRRVGAVNLNTEFDALMAAADITKEQKSMLALSKELIWRRAPDRMLVAITAPGGLLRELFSIKGAGTLLRRGSIVEHYDRIDQVDRGRLTTLIETSFGRRVREDFFSRPLSRIYLEQGYRGVAMLVDTPLGGYLTKFAVTKDAQGEGIGSDLWTAVIADRPVFFWRARSDNPILPWYIKKCTGMHQEKSWFVFWRGIETSAIRQVIEYCNAQPVDIDNAR